MEQPTSEESFDAATLRETLTDLAERLAAREAQARIYLVGGAAMALEYDESRVTQDIDGSSRFSAE